MIMRTITLIIIHCSATPEGRRLDFETCRRDHIRHRGFTDIGYHFYITRDGEIHRGRPLEKVGAHCKNHNRHSIGICYEGGLSADCTSEGGNLAASKIRNLECPSYEICLIDYGCGKFNRKIHIMEQYP